MVCFKQSLQSLATSYHLWTNTLSDCHRWIFITETNENEKVKNIIFFVEKAEDAQKRETHPSQIDWTFWLRWVELPQKLFCSHSFQHYKRRSSGRRCRQCRQWRRRGWEQSQTGTRWRTTFGLFMQDTVSAAVFTKQILQHCFVNSRIFQLLTWLKIIQLGIEPGSFARMVSKKQWSHRIEGFSSSN